MSKETWLYLYENSELKKLYIGIGGSLGRVFQSHNKGPKSYAMQAKRVFSKRLCRFHLVKML